MFLGHPNDKEILLSDCHTCLAFSIPREGNHTFMDEILNSTVHKPCLLSENDWLANKIKNQTANSRTMQSVGLTHILMILGLWSRSQHGYPPNSYHQSVSNFLTSDLKKTFLYVINLFSWEQRIIFLHLVLLDVVLNIFFF